MTRSIITAFLFIPFLYSSNLLAGKKNRNKAAKICQKGLQADTSAPAFKLPISPLNQESEVLAPWAKTSTSSYGQTQSNKPLQSRRPKPPLITPKTLADAKSANIDADGNFNVSIRTEDEAIEYQTAIRSAYIPRMIRELLRDGLDVFRHALNEKNASTTYKNAIVNGIPFDFKNARNPSTRVPATLFHRIASYMVQYLLPPQLLLDSLSELKRFDHFLDRRQWMAIALLDYRKNSSLRIQNSKKAKTLDAYIKTLSSIEAQLFRRKVSYGSSFLVPENIVLTQIWLSHKQTYTEINVIDGEKKLTYVGDDLDDGNFITIVAIINALGEQIYASSNPIVKANLYEIYEDAVLLLSAFVNTNKDFSDDPMFDDLLENMLFMDERKEDVPEPVAKKTAPLLVKPEETIKEVKLPENPDPIVSEKIGAPLGQQEKEEIIEYKLSTIGKELIARELRKEGDAHWLSGLYSDPNSAQKNKVIKWKIIFNTKTRKKWAQKQKFTDNALEKTFIDKLEHAFIHILTLGFPAAKNLEKFPEIKKLTGRATDRFEFMLGLTGRVVYTLDSKHNTIYVTDFDCHHNVDYNSVP